MIFGFEAATFQNLFLRHFPICVLYSVLTHDINENSLDTFFGFEMKEGTIFHIECF